MIDFNELRKIKFFDNIYYNNKWIRYEEYLRIMEKQEISIKFKKLFDND